MKKAVTVPMTKISAKLKAKWRKAVTGDETKRVRDLIKEKEGEPKYIKLFDKIAFTLGVLNIEVCQHFLLNLPDLFWLWYSLVMPILLITRYHHFKSLQWGYFMYDFCYFVVCLTFLSLLVVRNSSSLLFKILFIFTNGPLCIAIVVWRNSLVFHDFDKITSVFIHILPSMLFYCGRWYGHKSMLTLYQENTNTSANSCFNSSVIHEPKGSEQLEFIHFVYAALLYLCWQVAYFIKTEILDKEILDQHPQMLTSLRWLSTDTKNSMAVAVLTLCRRIGVMRLTEEYDHRTVKTKVVFMCSQFLYTISTFLLVPLLFYFKYCHIVYIILIFTNAVFNGASFYVEVFSKRYQSQFTSKSNVIEQSNAMNKMSCPTLMKLEKIQEESDVLVGASLLTGGQPMTLHSSYDSIGDILKLVD